MDTCWTSHSGQYLGLGVPFAAFSFSLFYLSFIPLTGPRPPHKDFLSLGLGQRLYFVHASLIDLITLACEAIPFHMAGCSPECLEGPWPGKATQQDCLV